MPMTDEELRAVHKHLSTRWPETCPMCRVKARWGIRRQLVVIADADPTEEHRSDWRFIVLTCNDCHFCAFYPWQRIMGTDPGRPDDWWR